MRKMNKNVEGRKKVAIIGTVGVPANYGGFETLAEHMIEGMTERYDVIVYCSGKRYTKDERLKTYKGARLHYLPLEANGIQSIPYDTLSIIHALFSADVLIVLGVAGAWTLPFVRMFTRKKIIVSIDGIEWKRDKWNVLAKWYLFWAEGLAVKYSHVDISDNEAIQDYTAARYGTLSRIIEYGADHTLKVQPDESAKQHYGFLSKPYAFKVCRIEPENNVHVILEAFSKCEVLPLVMVGNWDKSSYGKDLKNQYSQFVHLHLLDPIYNQEKLDTLRSNATLYIHGHSAGGTNPSLVEAMYLGLPIVSYGVSYNRVTTENRALYFMNMEELIEILRNLQEVQLFKMGAELAEIAHRRYVWKNIAFKYVLLVDEALSVKSKSSAFAKTTKVPYSELLSKGYAHLKRKNKF
jgi:glycosyltransferase involved in cell wall biosynthesis